MSASAENPILFAVESHAGLRTPLQAIAGALARRGVSALWFATTDDAKQSVEALGDMSPVRHASLGPHWPEMAPDKWDDDAYAEMYHTSRRRSYRALLSRMLNADYAEDMYRRVLEAVDEIRPALMVIDGNFPPAIDAAMTREVPYVLNAAMPVSFLYTRNLPWRFPSPMSGLPRRMSPAQLGANVLFRLFQHTVFLSPKLLPKAMEVTRRRRASGIENVAVTPARYADGAVAVIGNSVFGVEYTFPGVPSHVKMLGAMVPTGEPDRARHGDLFTWLDRHESVVYIGLGTITRLAAHHVAALLDVVRELGPEHHVLWSMSTDQQRLLPAELPANLRVESWVPQPAVLAHTNVRVSVAHGGAGGANQGIYFGTPMLMVPFGWDNRDIAVRVVDSGAGLMIQDGWRLNADEIVGKLRRLLTENSFQERATHWSDRMRAAGGADAAADLILSHLPGSVPHSPGSPHR
ncbi:glycosyltransferase [Goodfellowiella coeruleoviolacea]|uniref:Polyene glycosyltransferase n=1 Tax=Goodfellowiella coeruleoviolacea TaxID=334858 RepID=A0AAE3GMS5_9PSEU|nr:glycosyltransferase [Goodfellowiella coeruleoviolacea]MCP2170264.1 polyene glycosyltransferase [Goodfellowiella coeruleoviolacea]